MDLNETHDGGLRSWVPDANDAATDFPVQNLPFGIFRRRGSSESWRGGVAIGGQVLDLAAAAASCALPAARTGPAAAALACAGQPVLNDLMGLGAAPLGALRLILSRALRMGAPQQSALQACLVRQDDAEMALPARIGDYTDFYTSLHHATRVGKLMRPDNPLLPNYKWVPIGYHGRCSSIVVSGEGVRRPQGQRMPPGSEAPVVGPSERLDYELELGVFIGRGNELGSSIALDDAQAHVFGLCLLNDWSARDLQAWEYQPLGPFLGKNFATTISPWIVTSEALAPYRVPWTRPAGDPQPLPYLQSQQLRESGALDIELAVYIETQRMRAANVQPHRLSLSNFRDCYWSVAQMIAHHSVNGCNLRPGDLLGTGTQSGPAPAQAGSLLELSQGGRQPLTLPNGEQRRFLDDGDVIILRAACRREGYARLGFGEARGRIEPARWQADAG
ncbi:MAG TPA: fumarylacetoacetase [Steroidobacteraceae bacterium]|nr:fumarylacetoacetase [Steroidobacteraceae bacterium]